MHIIDSIQSTDQYSMVPISHYMMAERVLYEYLKIGRQRLPQSDIRRKVGRRKVNILQVVKCNFMKC